jgi:hypothetical protein
MQINGLAHKAAEMGAPTAVWAAALAAVEFGGLPPLRGGALTTGVRSCGVKE